jgi:hypothetical protein
MRGKRTWRWWAVRLELALGLAGVLFGGWLALTIGTMDWMFGPPQPARLIPVAVWVVMVIAFVWMVRIFRGPRDDPPPWRYRGR